MLSRIKEMKSSTPKHDFLVCIDSDGCVFDTMSIKQRECFCPWMIWAFGLQPVAKAARECKEFADLFSMTRGANRHKTMKRILCELLPSHPVVKARGFRVPKLPNYFSWVDGPNSLLSDDGLRHAIASSTDGQARVELERVLSWSERVNWAVSEIVRGIPPFPGVREALRLLGDRADIVVVSATPLEALIREWEENNIASHVTMICGQELGTKEEHIAAVGASYSRDRILVIGDAPGDLCAARANSVLFYPIVPGSEEASWESFVTDGLARFFRGTYAGNFEDGLVSRFEQALPELPPWKERE